MESNQYSFRVNSLILSLIRCLPHYHRATRLSSNSCWLLFKTSEARASQRGTISCCLLFLQRDSNTICGSSLGSWGQACCVTGVAEEERTCNRRAPSFCDATLTVCFCCQSRLKQQKHKTKPLHPETDHCGCSLRRWPRSRDGTLKKSIRTVRALSSGACSLTAS